ncbi:regulatory protein AfsR [Streptomyces melanogenes]|nr:regulatory protein AfsR [Streptomyces melanogenes]
MLLGPPVVSRGGTVVKAMQPQQMAMLAALAFRAGRRVGTEDLIDGMFGDTPPPSAVNMVTNYVLRLRKSLGATAVVWSSGGYLLDVDPACVDATEFLRRTGTPPEGDPVAEAERLGGALALWTGETALAGLPGPWCQRQRESLAEHREAARQGWFDQQLLLGRHERTLVDITAASRARPYDERLYATLMIALTRSGRQAEALDVYRRARSVLIHELGVDPGPDLARVHEAILRGEDPGPPFAAAAPVTLGAAVPALSVAPASFSPAAPQQLPSPPADLTGRQDQVAGLVDALRSAGHAVGMVTGMGGSGKTTLATVTAHAVAGDFPDGQLWASLHGASDTPADPGDVLADFLLALGVAPEQLPDATAQRAVLYRTMLADKRVLVVLDDAADTNQITPLLPGSPRSAVLVTSRTRPTIGVSAAVALERMARAESVQLIAAIIGAERAAAEPDAVVALAAACGDLPLALRVVATRLAHRPGWSVRSMVDRLADEARLLGELRTGDLRVAQAFELSYGQLTPDQAHAFLILALPKAHTWSLSAAAAVLALDEHAAEQVLEDLVDTALLNSPQPGHYAFHDLVRVYARAKAREQLDARDHAAALTRAVDFVHATVAACLRTAAPAVMRAIGPRGATPTVSAGASGLDDGAAARAWIRTELSAIVAICEQAAAQGDREAVVHAVETVGVLAAWTDATPMAVLAGAAEALAVATAPGGRAYSGDFTHAIACHATGSVRVVGPRPRSAIAAFTEALRFAGAGAEDAVDKLRPHYLTSFAHYGLALTYLQLREFAEARHHARVSIEVAARTGNEDLIHQHTLVLLQIEARDEERHVDTGDLARQVLELAAWFERTGDQDSAINAIIIAGDARHHSGQFVQAAHLYERAQALASAVRSGAVETVCHYRAAEAYAAAADGNGADALARAALRHAAAAVEGATRCAEELITARAHQAMGKALAASGSHRKAHEHLTLAVTGYSHLGMTSEADLLTALMAAGGPADHM